MGDGVMQQSVARDRSGKLKKGLLLWLIALTAVCYFGVEIGGVYWRRYKLEETVKQELGFAGQRTDQAIHQRLLDEVAAMDLPTTAQYVRFFRTDRPRALNVSISYVETVNLLFTTMKFPVSIEVRRRF